MAVIGITGTIASGKSTLRDLLAPLLTADIFNADLIARNFLEQDDLVRNRVREEISPRAYRRDGSIDRSEIRRIIYNDLFAKSRLEAILHPLVRKQWTTQAARARKEGRHFIVDIPLLFETDAAEHFDFIITIACSPTVQNERLASRGIGPDLAEKILSTQMPVSEKISRSTHMIWNDGTLATLEAQARQFVMTFGKNCAI